MRGSRFLTASLAFALLVALAPAALAQSRGAAPTSGTIPGRYIVTLVDGADPAAVAREYRARGADVDHVYRTALRGFAGAVPASELERLRADERVVRVEADGWAHATELTTQADATWGLDRVDQRNLPLGGTYAYETTATNVTAYVIDTGIRASHVDFGGRVSGGFTAIDDGRGTGDCNGHGTHVAGTIGGTTWGVAKGVSLVPVRVLNCRGSGTWSGVIAGIDWVTANATRPAVANMSLGGGANDSVDAAVRRSIASGVVYALAAGNDSGTDACTRSPARVTEGLTVGATTSTDARASYSNIGVCLDLFAPGSSITSAWKNSDTATNTISGTSMATPHVAGAAALYLAGNTAASVSTVNGAVVANATPDLVGNEGAGSPDLLLHSLFGTAAPSGPAAPADFAATAVSTSEIRLSWSDVADETHYLLTLPGATEPTVLSAGTTSYAHTGLDPNTTYEYALQAVNDDGSSAVVTASATTASDGTTPTAPVADFTTACGGTATCTFDGTSSSDDVTSWRWSFGAEGAVVTATFGGPGSYTVVLTVTNAAGLTDDASQTVTCGWSGKGKNKVLACS